MAFDGITTKLITYELQNSILDGKINKVYEPNKNEILLGIYANGKNFALNICIDSNSYRIHLTTHSKPNPLNAPNFCMLLRKHLLGYKIKSISSKSDLERIVQIELEGYNELNDLTTKYLIIELMGKHSNIILLNNNFFIIDSLRHLDTFSNSYRDILPAREYVYPENSKKSFYNVNSFDIFNKLVLENNVTNLTNFLVNYFTGFSKNFIKNVILQCNINNSNFSKEDLTNLYEYLCKILNNLNTNTVSLKSYTNENDKLDYTVDVSIKESNLDCNFFIDDFYYEKEQNSNFISYRNNLLKLISHVLKKYDDRLKNINTKLKECNNKNIYKLYGELITANLYKIPKFYNSDKIELENYYDNNNLIKIPLNKKYSPNINAKHYFKKYNKLKNALQIVSVQKAETENELNYIDSIIFEIELASSTKEIQEILDEISENLIKNKVSQKKKNTKNSKKKKQEKQYSPLHFNIDNFDVYVGKNNKENDWLTFTFANKNDIWLHTKDIQGSHVIIKTLGLNISDDTLVKCAKLAVEHSKAKLSSNVPVDYCKVQYVKKPNSAKPGMVIFTNNKTISVTSCQ